MRVSVIISLILCLDIITPVLTPAKLASDEIAVLVNTNSSDSLRLGELYIKLRNIPVDHLISVNVSTEENISRNDYDELIAEPVRTAINGIYEEGKEIRCIVTTYGIPLRINALKPLIMPEPEIKEYSKIRKNKKEKRAELVKIRDENKNPDKELNKEINKLKSEIDQLNLKIGNLKGLDTIAAVDSELALVLLPDYKLAGWQLNPGHLHNRGRISYFGKVLMVSRLDAPNPELAEGLIRTAIDIENTGLSGKVYLDARGKTGSDAYGKFDEDIRRAAVILRQGRLPVIIDNRPGLFGQGEAVSAALYCGWYSLGKYVDAFEWSRGAVAYHVASVEAITLHNPKAENWVKRMIEDGVTATLGPVNEPYLQSFPLPSEFFPLLMSGRYTLADVFAMTNPFLSWRMILVGDPLYNPFKNKPAFELKNPPPAPD